MRKFLLILQVLALICAPLAIALAAQLPNPVIESTVEEAQQASGTYGVTLPEGASEPKYSYIKGSEGPVIFQVHFVWQGADCVYRVSKAQALEDISGMYMAWQHARQLKVGVYEGRLMYTPDDAGVVMWYDQRNEMTYSASMSKGASAERLMQLAYANAEWEQEEGAEAAFEALPGEAVTDEAALSAALGLPIKLPEGLENARYYLLAGENPLASASFTLDGVDYLYFVQKAAEASDPSGRLGPWSGFGEAKLGEMDAFLVYKADGEGLITWYNSVEGANHSLVLKQGQWPDALTAAAEKFI